jgi:uncharacterized protein (DUF2252 family)
VGSFGTWRDAEGRLAWGVNDFDDAYPLPYTNDLVRLAASVKIGIDLGHLSLTLKQGCDAILDGYRISLRAGGCPFVLAEEHTNLRRLGFDAIKPPKQFWQTLQHLPGVARVPPGLRRVFARALDRRVEYKIVRREGGLGSLGQRRFVAFARWRGGLIGREAKAVMPSSLAWLSGRVDTGSRITNARSDTPSVRRIPF